MNKKDIKQKFISLKNEMKEHQETDDCKDERFVELAIAYIEQASMLAVGSCFSEEERDQH